MQIAICPRPSLSTSCLAIPSSSITHLPGAIASLCKSSASSRLCLCSWHLISLISSPCLVFLPVAHAIKEAAPSIHSHLFLRLYIIQLHTHTNCHILFLSKKLSVRVPLLPIFSPVFSFPPIYLLLVASIQVVQHRRVPSSSILAFIIPHFPRPPSHRARQPTRNPCLSSERFQGRQVGPDRENHCTAYGQPPKCLPFRAQAQRSHCRSPPVLGRRESVSLPKPFFRSVRALRPRQLFGIYAVPRSIPCCSYRLNKVVVPYHRFLDRQSSKESFEAHMQFFSICSKHEMRCTSANLFS